MSPDLTDNFTAAEQRRALDREVGPRYLALPVMTFALRAPIAWAPLDATCSDPSRGDKLRDRVLARVRPSGSSIEESHAVSRYGARQVTRAICWLVDWSEVYVRGDEGPVRLPAP